jgi:[ribosomal protein S5]-alanine N-acetyltransferase
MRYWTTPPWPDSQPATTMITTDQQEMTPNGDYLRLGIIHTADNQLIGQCCLFDISPTNRRAEIGYSLARTAWRQGYITEALTSFINYAFTHLNLNRIEADIDPRNIASAKTLEKLHFQREGYLRQRWIVANEITDTAFYGLLRQEWPHLK